MFRRLRKFFGSSARPSQAWQVTIRDHALEIRDRNRGHRRIPLRAIERIVAITSDYMPRRTHVVLLFYTHHPDPVAVLPLEAQGIDAALAAFARLGAFAGHTEGAPDNAVKSGFAHDTLERARSSGRVGRFEIYRRAARTAPAAANTVRSDTGSAPEAKVTPLHHPAPAGPALAPAPTTAPASLPPASSTALPQTTYPTPKIAPG